MKEPRFYEFDQFRLDAKQRILWRDGQMLVLPPKVFDTLHSLVRRRGEIVEREELLSEVWGQTFVEEGNLSVNISHLRKVLGKDLIETIPRRGYRLTASISTMWDEALPISEPDLSQVEGTVPGSELSFPKQEGAFIDSYHGANRNRFRLVLVGITILLVGALAVIAWRTGPAYFSRKSDSRPAANSIAVLPFQNLSGDQSTDYLSDGLSESLINKLSSLPKLKVIAQAYSLRYKGKEIDPAEVGRTLNVEALLTGRVAQRGDDLVINVELIDARDRTQVWGEQYNRKFADILAVQADIVRQVTERLRLKLSGEDIKQLASRYPESPEAYQAYLKGRFFMLKWTPEGFKKAVEYFNEAITRDPKFSLAYLGLSYCYYAGNWQEPFRESFQKGRTYAQKALEIDPTLAGGHTALGVIAVWLDNDGATAEAEFKRAIELDPAYAPAHVWYGFLLMTQRRFDQSISEAKQADELEPLNNLDGVGVYLFYAHRYEEAEQTLRSAIEFQPNGWFAHLFMGRLYEMKGDLPAAIAELESTARMNGVPPEVWSALGYAYARAGRKKEAIKIIDELKEQSKHLYVPAYSYAVVYAGLGDKDKAFAYLEKEYSEGAYYLCLYKVDPEIDNLRGDPRFAALLRRMKLSP